MTVGSESKSASSSQTLRVAVVGCGAIASGAHLPALQALSEKFTVTAVFDQDSARASEFAESASAKSLASLEEVFGLADVALVATPLQAHKDPAITLLEGGVHVFCEKPLARNADECDAIIAAATRSGKLIYTGYYRRNFQSWSLIKKVTESRIAGGLVSILIEEGCPFNWPVGSASFFDREVSGGGALLDSGVHDIDLAVYLSSEPLRVLHYEDDTEDGVEANALAILGSSSATYSVRVSRTHDLLNRVVATFEHAVISAQCWDGAVCSVLSWEPEVDKAILADFAAISKSASPNPFQAQWSDFHSLVVNGAKTANEQDSRDVVRIVDECYKMRVSMPRNWKRLDQRKEVPV